MEAPADVAEMVRLRELGTSIRAIAAQMGCSRNTVRRYLRMGGWRSYGGDQRRGRLAGLEEWLKAELRRHGGNADVVRQELWRQHGIAVSLRTVERAVAGYRQALEAERVATTRFETPPGKQLQVDFGSRQVVIAGTAVRVYIFVATLGYSRRSYVAAFASTQQHAWFRGLEGAFQHFGGVPEEVLVDNAKTLVNYHDGRTGEVIFHVRFQAFARHWGFRPKACRPFRARTKGKDERSVGYVKRNALAGHDFASWAALDGHLAAWLRQVADERHHGTTGERPIVRFRAAEAAALKPLGQRPSFLAMREVTRRVRRDCTVAWAGNAYSVPWTLIGEDVRLQAFDGWVIIHHGAREVARHTLPAGQNHRVTRAEHFAGITRDDAAPPGSPPASAPDETAEAGLQRSLATYEALVAEVAR